MSGEQSRFGGTNFERVPQVDIDYDGNDELEHGGREWSLSGRERFKNIVRGVLRHDQSATPYKANSRDAHTSPALSDATLVNEDYLSLPIQQFDEVDLREGRYADVTGHYGPEVVDNNAATSYSNSAAISEGLEVRVESHPLALSPGGLHVDDRIQDYNHRGSEERTAKPLPTRRSKYHYKPVPLRWPFILVAFGGLVALFTLAELALHLLPYTSDMEEPLPILLNVSEIRKKSVSYEDVAVRTEHHFVTLRDDTGTNGSSTALDLTTEIETATTAHSTTITGEFIGVDSNAETASHADSASPTRSSATEPGAFTTQSQSEQISTTKGVTEVTFPETSSSKVATSHHTDPQDQPPSSTDQRQPSGTEQDTTSPTAHTSDSHEFTSLTHTKPKDIPTPGHSGVFQTTPSQDTATPPQNTVSPSTVTPPLDTATPSPVTASQNTVTPQDITTLSQDITTPSSGPPAHDTTTPPQDIATAPQDFTTSSPGTAQDTATPPQSTPTPPQNTPTASQSTATPSPVTPSPVTPSPVTSSPVTPPSSTATQLQATTTLQQITLTLPLDITTALHHTTALPQDTTAPPEDTPAGTPNTASPSGDTLILPQSTTIFPSHSVNIPGNPATFTIGLPHDINPTGEGPTNRTTTTPGNPTTFLVGLPHDTTSPGERLTHHTMTTPSLGSNLETTPLPTSGNFSDPDTTSQLSPHKPTSTRTPLDMTDSTGQQAEVASSDTTSPSFVTSKTISGTEILAVAHNASTHIASQPVSFSTSTQLSPQTDPTPFEINMPFTTLTLTENTETPSPAKTTTFKASSSIAGSGYVEVIKTSTIIPGIKAAVPLSDFTSITTYTNGTVSTIFKKVYDLVTTSIQYDAAGSPIKTVYVHILQSAQVTTLRNSLGSPTATVNFYEFESATTLYDNNGIATATATTTIPETGAWTTLRDGRGWPFTTVMLMRPIVTDGLVGTPTPTASPPAPSLEIKRLPDATYIAGLVIPTLLAILVSIPIRILSRTVKMYQGFHALASDHGASGIESLYLATTGPASLLSGVWSLRSGHYLLALANILAILGALTIPFSTEVLKPMLNGPQCHDGIKPLKCSVVLGVSPVPTQVFVALLVALLAGIIVVAALLRRWKTGVERDPWSIADMAHLAAGTDMRKSLERLRRYKGDFVDKMRANTFGLREWEENGTIKYSVLILNQEADDTAERPVDKAGRSVTFVDPKRISRPQRFRWLSGDSSPFYMLSFTGRMMLILLLSGVLTAVIAYDIDAWGSESPGWRTENAVGARFLFSGAGVLITFAWGSFFNNVALLSPYKLLHRRRLNKGRAIHINPATNPFTGVSIAFVPSRRDIYLGAVAATAILSELLPLFLGNIPYSGIQVQSLGISCVYLSVAILSIMILIVGSSFFIGRPPKLGVDPTTIGGAMYAAHVLSVDRPMRRFFKKEASNIV